MLKNKKRANNADRPLDDRDSFILNQRAAGQTFRSIGIALEHNTFGIAKPLSVERTRQLFNRAKRIVRETNQEKI